MITCFKGDTMHTVWFKDLGKHNIPEVGGKGANLGEMWNAKIPIPPGFCVTVAAYDKFIEKASIKDEITSILKELDVDDSEKLHEAGEKIQKLIIGSEMPKDIEAAIIEDYEKIQGFVAVRSSATAEDLPTASFAGQHDTFLNIEGAEDVVKHVKECWASLFTPRAIYYREKNNFEHMNVLISVVIQKMINSDSAGVMFTVNPVTNNDAEMIIEGSFGLGEMVVSGSVSPDNYLIDKSTLKPKSINVMEKRKALYRHPEGYNHEVELDSEKANKQVLEEAEIIALARMGQMIENHYSQPMDIEWAIEKGELFITQARPVTTFKK